MQLTGTQPARPRYSVAQEIEEINSGLETTILQWVSLHNAGHPIRWKQFEGLGQPNREALLNSIKTNQK